MYISTCVYQIVLSLKYFQSLLLTASILNGSSILTDDLGAQGTDNEDEIFDDEWIVPDVSLSFTQHDDRDINQVR